MAESKQAKKSSEEQNSVSQPEQTPQASEKPYILSIRTGLTQEKDAITVKLPSNHLDDTVEDALDYLLSNQKMNADEKRTADSVKNEMRNQDYVISINGKNAKLTDKIVDYAVEKTRKLPNNQNKVYGELEIEVASVQRGGYRRGGLEQRAYSL